MKKILLIMDQPLLIRGVCTLLKTEQENLDIQSSKTGANMLEMLKNNEYQLVIIKRSLVANSIVAQVLKLKPALSILVLADSFDSDSFHELYKSGALGVFNLHDDLNELSFAINQTLNKNIYMANYFKMFLLGGSNTVVTKAAFKKLTKRESEIARLMLTGKRMWEIGSILKIKASTVTTFKSKIYTKLGVSNLLELDQVAKRTSQFHQNAQ